LGTEPRENYNVWAALEYQLRGKGRSGLKGKKGENMRCWSIHRKIKGDRVGRSAPRDENAYRNKTETQRGSLAAKDLGQKKANPKK